MFFAPQRLSISWASICISLAGVAYCVIQALPVSVSVPCPGTGCQLFQNFAIHGVSLWWVGVAYFAFMSLLCLRRANALALFIATSALLVDAVLLAVMLMTAACVVCLGAGAFMALLYLSLLRHIYPTPASPSKQPLVLFLWGGLFIAAASLGATEAIEPWKIAGAENAERRVYFAPSCPACQDAVIAFDGNAAFIPIAEKESDYAAVYAMLVAIQNGQTTAEALKTALEAQKNGTLAELPFPNAPFFHLKLIRNKAEVLRLGFDKLPLIMINGMPQSLHPNSIKNQPSQPTARNSGRMPASDSSALPPELLAPLNACGEVSLEPCDTPQ